MTMVIKMTDEDKKKEILDDLPDNFLAWCALEHIRISMAGMIAENDVAKFHCKEPPYNSADFLLLRDRLEALVEKYKKELEKYKRKRMMARRPDRRK